LDAKGVVDSLVESVTELEHKFQQAAFDLVREGGDYELSESILATARDLRALGFRVEGLASGRPQEFQQTARDRQPTQRNPRPQYPRFEVSDDRITKIGKGKKRGAEEYRHEAPVESLNRLIAWFDHATASGEHEWSAQAVVEALAPDVPSYQTYLLLAALRSVGLLTLVRRGIYGRADKSVPTSRYWDVLRAECGEGNGGRS